MRLHEFRVIRGSISCTPPLSFLHFIAGDDVHANPVNLTSNNLRQPDHFLSLPVPWDDFLGNSLQDFLGRRRQADAAQNMIVFEMSKCTSLFVGRSLKESRILWSGRRKYALFESDIFHCKISEALVSQMTQEGSDLVPLSP